MSEMTLDQAEGLRRLSQPSPVRVLAVTGGKGGVGKTSVSVNLAVAASQYHKVLLIDADLGLANIDVVLGLQHAYDLSHVMSGERELDEIIVQGPGGIQVVPGASGIQQMAEMSPAEHAGLISAFDNVGTDCSLCIVDTAAGISDTVVSFSRAAHDVLVVICDEPASITDAYAIIKLLHRDYGHERFQILANMVRSEREGRDLFQKIAKVTQRYLDVLLTYAGSLPFDDHLKRAVKAQKPVVEAFPRSRVAGAFKTLAKRIDDWPMPQGANGQLQFFVERLIRYSNENGEGI